MAFLISCLVLDGALAARRQRPDSPPVQGTVAVSYSQGDLGFLRSTGLWLLPWSQVNYRWLKLQILRGAPEGPAQCPQHVLVSVRRMFSVVCYPVKHRDFRTACVQAVPPKAKAVHEIRSALLSLELGWCSLAFWGYGFHI